MSEQSLDLRYVPLSTAHLWDKNPKTHDIPSIIRSIEEYGFRDPPEYDATLEAIVAGNGRITSLTVMRDRGDPPPRYVKLGDQFSDSNRSTTKDWLVPIVFGADARSKKEAERYAVDHNLLTLAEPRVSSEDVQRMFRKHDMESLFPTEDDDLPLTLSKELMEEIRDRSATNDIELENFDDSLAEGFASVRQFGIKVQLIVDLTEQQSKNEELKASLKQLARDHNLQYRIKSKK